jgi:hypothetical protein
LSRHLLIRGEDGDRLVPQSPLPTEANLHDALADNPDLLPAADLGLGTNVVAGKESFLGLGFADLILLDDLGQLCLVETKKDDNRDIRKVVAQLLDYAAHLWGQTPDEFLHAVVQPYSSRRNLPVPESIETFIAASFSGDGAQTDESVDVALVARNLETTLQQGTFVLVVAAPEIPAGIERALNYLNEQGLRTYGLEVGYFRDQVECFVPRLTVRPPTVRRPSRTAVAPLERETFLEQLDDWAAAIVARTLDTVEETGAQVSWNAFGPTIKSNRGTPRQLGAFDRKGTTDTNQAADGLLPAAAERARTRLDQAGFGSIGTDGARRRLNYNEATPAQLQEFADVLVELSREEHAAGTAPRQKPSR